MQSRHREVPVAGFKVAPRSQSLVMLLEGLPHFAGRLNDSPKGLGTKSSPTGAHHGTMDFLDSFEACFSGTRHRSLLSITLILW